MRQAKLTEEVFQKTEGECKAAWVEAKNKFVLFKPNAAKAADEHWHQLSKLIADRNDTNPDVEHHRLNHNIRQQKFVLKFRRINKKVKRGFVQKFVFHNKETGESTAVEDRHPNGRTE